MLKLDYMGWDVALGWVEKICNILHTMMGKMTAAQFALATVVVLRKIQSGAWCEEKALPHRFFFRLCVTE